jgi:hypothetical protein
METESSPAINQAKKEINMNPVSTGATGLPYSAETEASDKAFAERLAELRGDAKKAAATTVSTPEKTTEMTSGKRGQHDLYAAINAYYFPLKALLDLDEFQLLLESPKGNTVTFRLNNARLY